MASLLLAGMAAAAPPPVIGAWFWTDPLLDGEAYRPFLDAAAAHSPYSLLTTSLRTGRGEITDVAFHDQIGRAVRYAAERRLKVAFDLDVRLARRAFQARYPDEMQEELVLKTVPLPAEGTVSVVIEGQDLSDHMTGGTIPYRVLATRLERVYAYRRGADGIDPATVREITAPAQVDAPRRLTVTLPAGAGQEACVIATHTYLTPDVFAPHLLAFQREIVRQYADVPLSGVMKDEWGHPPDHSGNPAHDRYWFSKPHAAAYAQRLPGGDLVRDSLLMYVGEVGRSAERSAAVDAYRALCLERNAAIEEDYYAAGKATFGPDCFVGTHATWVPYPGAQEMRKQGLDWWHARRDIGQSDETTPYACRTSLAKRWGYPIWFNQYYSPRPEAYQHELWANALAGGRVNFHPLYPRDDLGLDQAHLALLRLPLMRGLSRLRLLDHITAAPLDCPVAVVFGHGSAMNWTSPSYNDVGLDIVSGLARAGWPADLVPSSMVAAKALRLDGEGYVCLGPQRYRAVVLHQPDPGDQAALGFFAQAAAGPTAVFVVGDQRIPRAGACADGAACVDAVKAKLAQAGVPTVTGWSVEVPAWGHVGTQAAPPADGHSRLTDGTWLRIAGAKDAAGDPIQETIQLGGKTIEVDAEGLFAIRLDGDAVAAVAAGGLKRLVVGDLKVELPQRADVAWNALSGLLIGWDGDVPPELARLAPMWARLAEPPRLP
ncbi:MAG: hypothetical protein HZB16_20520 [Armatimonadetes bacterium]|nr:hypothetical protein [Armatimonadota bacterium]